MISPSPASSDLVEHISAQSGSLPSASRLAPYFAYSASVESGSGPPAQKVHLSIFPRELKLPVRGYCGAPNGQARSEEHTSELQSIMRISYAVFCLKKKKTTNQTPS